MDHCSEHVGRLLSTLKKTQHLPDLFVISHARRGAVMPANDQFDPGSLEADFDFLSFAFFFAYSSGV